MKVNFNVSANYFSGSPLVVLGKEVNIAEELGKTMFFYGNNEQASIDEKYKAYKIGQKLSNGDTEYTAEELSFIKEMAGRSLAAGVYGQIVDLIEGVRD